MTVGKFSTPLPSLPPPRSPLYANLETARAVLPANTVLGLTFYSYLQSAY